MDNRSGALDALVGYATSVDLRRLPLPPRVEAAWLRHCGAARRMACVRAGARARGRAIPGMMAQHATWRGHEGECQMRLHIDACLCAWCSLNIDTASRSTPRCAHAQLHMTQLNMGVQLVTLYFCRRGVPPE